MKNIIFLDSLLSGIYNGLVKALSFLLPSRIISACTRAKTFPYLPCINLKSFLGKVEFVL